MRNIMQPAKMIAVSHLCKAMKVLQLTGCIYTSRGYFQSLSCSLQYSFKNNANSLSLDVAGYIMWALIIGTYTHYTGCEFTCPGADCSILDFVIWYSSLFKHIWCIEVNLQEKQKMWGHWKPSFDFTSV